MKMKITLHGVAYEVEVELLDEVEGYGTLSGLPPVPRFVQSHPMPTNQSNDGILPPPSRAAAGAAVKSGQELLILEAMKMQTSINSPVDGTIKSINVSAGDTVRESQVLVEFQ